MASRGRGRGAGICQLQGDLDGMGDLARSDLLALWALPPPPSQLSPLPSHSIPSHLEPRSRAPQSSPSYKLSLSLIPALHTPTALPTSPPCTKPALGAHDVPLNRTRPFFFCRELVERTFRASSQLLAIRHSPLTRPGPVHGRWSAPLRLSMCMYVPI